MRKINMIVLCASVLAGCDGVAGPAVPASQPADGAAPPARREVMALVNGRPVYMDVLYDLLVSGPGGQFAVELVRHEMVRQAAEEKGITLTDHELQAEHQRILTVAFPGVEQASDREQALRELLARKEVSRKQWDMSVRTSAFLRRLAEPMVKITDGDLQEEFGRQYGRQVVVRHIQVAKLADAQKVKDLAAKKDFAELVAEFSINPSAAGGGKLPPIGLGSEGIPPAIRQAAMALKKVGEISDPIQVGTTFHILRLEERLEPKNVKFEAVRDKLKADLTERRIRQGQKSILEDIIRRASVEYVNPTLKARDAADRLLRGNLP